jgi:hypothetical protein
LEAETGEKVVSLNNAYAAMTMDVIISYCFGQSMSSLARPEYGKNWLDMLHSAIQMRPFDRQFPWHVNTFLDNTAARHSQGECRYGAHCDRDVPNVA